MIKEKKEIEENNEFMHKGSHKLGHDGHDGHEYTPQKYYRNNKYNRYTRKVGRARIIANIPIMSKPKKVDFEEALK